MLTNVLFEVALKRYVVTTFSLEFTLKKGPISEASKLFLKLLSPFDDYS
jgi:hypothetical protein